MNKDVVRRLPIFRSQESFERGRGQLVVECPRIGKTLSIDECVACELGDGVGLDRAHRSSYVRCACAEETPRERETSELLEATAVGDVMSELKLAVSPRLPVRELVALLLDHRISAAPVLDQALRLIGMVSKSDVLRAHRRQTGREADRTSDAAQDRALREFAASAPASLTVDEVLSPVRFSLPAGAPVSRAVQLMDYEGVSRLPIVSAGGEVIGMLSALEILDWLARRRR